MKISRIILFVAIIVVLGLILRKLFFGKEGGEAMKAPVGKGVPVLSAYAVNSTLNESIINASGSLVSSEEVVLRTETSGKIVKLNIREGQLVTKGELLLKINDEELSATQRKLNSRLELARQKLARQKSLLEAKAIGQEEFDISANEVAVLEADLEYNSALIRKTEIRAPFNGKIGLKNISEGSFVTPAIEIAVLHQLNPLKLDFSVPEKYAGRIRPGSDIRFTLEGNDEVFSAELYAVDPRIDPVTRTVKMRAMVKNASGKLFPGAFARITVSLGKSESLMIPTHAVIPVLKGKKVFISKSGTVLSRVITTGERTETHVQVLTGLAPGDTVITSGIMQLRDSMQVSVSVVK
jgi:membrane fusion protein (multidrug efflux system)